MCMKALDRQAYQEIGTLSISRTNHGECCEGCQARFPRRPHERGRSSIGHLVNRHPHRASPFDRYLTTRVMRVGEGGSPAAGPLKNRMR
jgi:hypothetical protein